MAIFGGGYDSNTDPNGEYFDGDPSSANWTDVSRAVYVVNLDDGSILARIDHSTHSGMLYGLPSSPAVLDLNGDTFADVVYIGDTGGQLWKWDISAVGADTSGSDGRVDNWPAGVFFNAGYEVLADTSSHYRSIYAPPSASFDRGSLVLAFGTGERENLRYPGDGDSSTDEMNRFFVVYDNHPTGDFAFYDANGDARAVVTESSLTNVTNAMSDTNSSDLGFYMIADASEKFSNEPTIFGGYIIVTSYKPNSSDVCSAATGQANLYIFRLRNAEGYFPDPGDTAQETRRKVIGSGLGSPPRISIAPDPDDDRLYVKTSKGEIITMEAPVREDAGTSIIYWRQLY